MQRKCFIALNLLASLLLVATAIPSPTFAQEKPKKTVEPVFRVPKIKRDAEKSNATAEPQKVSEDLNSPTGPIESKSEIQPAVNKPVGSPDMAPVARVADARPAAVVPDKAPTNLVPKIDAAAEPTVHPLDRAITLAKDGLKNMQANIHDYTAILVKRERVGNQLSEPFFMKVKIRNPRKLDGRSVPFSIYMKFVRPRSVVGREVIWVEGQNNNNLIVHDTNPLVRFKNLHLDPNGFLAMKGNRYPIYEAGLEKLVLKLIEKAERDRAAGMCQVAYQGGATINKRPCTLIEVVHNTRCAPYEFYKAKVYIDDEYQIPVRFVAYDWPIGNKKPQIMEEYTYVNVSLNVGLKDSDFSVANRAYNFAR